MSGITQTTPAREPLFVDDVRNYLRLDDDIEETLIISLITAARQWAENYTGRVFITRTVNQFHDSYHYPNTYIPEGFYTGIDRNLPDTFIDLALSPIVSFTHVKAINDAGYGTSPINIPDAVRMAMMQYCSFMFEHRGDFERFPPPQPPKLLTQLLTPFQIMRFSTTPYSNVLRMGIG